MWMGERMYPPLPPSRKSAPRRQTMASKGTVAVQSKPVTNPAAVFAPVKGCRRGGECASCKIICPMRKR